MAAQVPRAALKEMNRDMTEHTIHRQDKTVRWDGMKHFQGSPNGLSSKNKNKLLFADETQLVPSEKPVARSPCFFFAPRRSVHQ
jgi:hypothetical protein